MWKSEKKLNIVYRASAAEVQLPDDPTNVVQEMTVEDKYNECLQSIVSFSKQTTKKKVEQHLKLLLKNVRMLLDVNEYDGQMSVCYKNKQIKWSDLIRKKNTLCIDATSRQCQLARRLIMFGIRGARVDENSIIVPGRMGKDNIVSTQIHGIDNMNGFCSDNIPLDPSFDFLKPFNKAGLLKFAWDEGHEHAFQSKTMPMSFKDTHEGFDRVDADPYAKKEWDNARQLLIMLLDSVKSPDMIDDIQKKEDEIMRILENLTKLFDIPLIENWEEISKRSVKSELGKLLNRCVSVSNIINVANIVQISFVIIFNKLRQLLSDDFINEEMRLRQGKNKVSSDQDLLLMPVSSRKYTVEKQRALQKELKDLQVQGSSSVEQTEQINAQSSHKEGDTDSNSKKKKKKKKKNKTHEENSDDEEELDKAVAENKSNRMNRLKERIRNEEFSGLDNIDARILISKINDDDVKEREEAFFIIASLCPHNVFECISMIPFLLVIIHEKNDFFVTENYRVSDLVWNIMTFKNIIRDSAVLNTLIFLIDNENFTVNVLHFIMLLSKYQENWDILRSSIPRIVPFLTNAYAEEKVIAILDNLSKDLSNSKLIFSHRVVPIILKLLSEDTSGSEKTTMLTRILANLATDNKRMKLSINEIQILLNILDEDGMAADQVVRAFAFMISNLHLRDVDQYIKAGIIPRIIKFMHNSMRNFDNPMRNFLPFCLSILNGLISVSNDDTDIINTIVKEKIIDILLKIIKTNEIRISQKLTPSDTFDHAVVLISTISGHDQNNEIHKISILDSGIVESLILQLVMLQPDDLSGEIKRDIISILNYLVIYDDHFKHSRAVRKIGEAGVIPPLIQEIIGGNYNSCIDLLSDIVDKSHPKKFRDSVVNAGGIEVLLNILHQYHNDENDKRFYHAKIGKIALVLLNLCEDTSHKERILEADFLPLLLKLKNENRFAEDTELNSLLNTLN